ncbi:MAG: DNA polymerase III subunit beta [Rickettsiaceae bacterium H1]|nr:DNA polymerase III subunit beta [Rickettsiaceae bacterium H1]
MLNNFTIKENITDNPSLSGSLLITKETITNALAHLVGTVEKRNAIQQLSHVKVESLSAKKIKLTATDMNMSITEIIEVENCDIGKSFTLPIVTLYDIVKKFPTGCLIKLNQNKHNIEITSGSVFFALPFLDGNDFPTIEEGKLPISFTLSQEDFVQLFGKTKFVISTEESRYNLTSLYLHSESGKLKATATDGHRLALTAINADIENFGVLISRKTVSELVKLFDKSKKEIKVFVSDNKVKFVYENIMLIAKLIAADFPNYREVIPKKYQKNILLNKQNFTEAIDRVSAIYMDKSKSVRLVFDDVLTISASHSDSSNSRETVKIKYTGERLDIRFNYSYLLEMLSHIDSEEVTICCNNNKSAAMIENGNTIYIIMPMSI